MTDLYDEMFGTVNRWDVEDIEEDVLDEDDPDDVDFEDIEVDDEGDEPW